jgi:hypothetical protein
VCCIHVPSYSEVEGVHDEYQYIFSGVEAMCWTCIIHSLITAVVQYSSITVALFLAICFLSFPFLFPFQQ